MKPELVNIELLAEEIKSLIQQSKEAAGRVVNSTLTMLYWQVGKRIQVEILNETRADYGKQVIVLLSQQQMGLYGSGWSDKHLWHCIQFASTFPDERIVSTVWRQLTWSHIKLIIYMDDSLKRDFYLQMAEMELWSVRTLQRRIQSMLYERTAISNEPFSKTPFIHQLCIISFGNYLSKISTL